MRKLIAALLLVAAVTPLYAADLTGDQIKQKLLTIRPDLPIMSIGDSALPGFYTVSLSGGQTLYVSADGVHFFAGDLYQIIGSNLVNLTENERTVRRKKIMDAQDESEMLVFAPKQRTAQVTVFTDVDCTYCRKFHQEVPELNKMGIAVRYMAYPRAGIPSKSYDKIVAAWCADNPQLALTKAKLGQPIEMKTCANPVAKEYEIGNEIGVTGTPALVLDDGRLIPGYMPATRLAALLGLHP